jgi:hypothetical protein
VSDDNLNGLDGHLKLRKITSARLEREIKRRAGSWPNRIQMYRIRRTPHNTRLKDMVRILWALREIENNPDLRIDEIFDFDTENPLIWR